MKVLVVGPSIKNSKGGMATVIKEIAEDKWLNEKCNITVFSSYIDGNIFVRLIYSAFAFFNFCATKKGYDIYHIHLASYGSTFRKALYARKAKRWGKKVILHIHGASFMDFYQQLSERRKKEVKKLLRQADAVIALSDSWKNKFDLTFGLENCVVLENGINIDKLEAGISDCKTFQKSFLMLGRLGNRKGTFDLIRAIKSVQEKVPEVKLYLAGDGEVEKALSLIKELKLEDNIELVGWADYNKKIKLLSQVSTLVLPSYNEGLPMAILEGMACGKVIISTTVGAIPEVVTEQNGILIEPGNIGELADAIIKCCENTEFMTDASEKNIEKIRQRFSMQAMHEKLLKYYEDNYEKDRSCRML